MSKQRLTLVRLQKQQRSLMLEPIPNLLIKRKGTLNFHFCIYGLEGVYAGGYYHGVLQLPADYPFSPPQLKFFTESGRFQTNKPICTSFTNFHKQEWSSAWNVRTMVLGVISFMTSKEGGYGSLNQSEAKRRQLAQKSLSRNMQSAEFVQLFKQDLKKLGVVSGNTIINKVQTSAVSEHPQKIQNSNLMYFLALILVILFISYVLFRDKIISYTNSSLASKQF